MSYLNDVAVAIMRSRLPIDYQQIAITRAILPEKLVVELAPVKGLEPRTNDLGNGQTVYRLDGSVGGSYVLTFPANADAAAVASVIAAHDPTPTPLPPPPPDAAERVATALASVSTLDPKTATVGDAVTTVNQLVAVVRTALA